MKLYAAIEKAEEQDDGTIIVTGYASSEDIDSQGEIVTAKAMADALPGYMEFANIREMHQAKAAGVAIEAEVQEDGRTWLKAHIVDDDAVKKVKKKVYKGFSIGGRVTDRDEMDKSIITGIQLSEISLVDRPANGKALFSLGKVDLDTATDAENATVGTEKSDATGEVQKGMYGVSQFASILASINWLQQDAEWEKGIEGDDSTMPDELKAWLKQGGALLSAMVSEEVAELTGGDEDDLELSDKTGDLQKAGARNSKADQEKLQSMHDNAVAMGADCGGAEKHDHVADLGKMIDLQNELTKLSSENTDLKKRVDELEALPQPAKGVTKIIGKEHDSTDVKKEEEPKNPHDAIKKSFQTPIALNF